MDETGESWVVVVEEVERVEVDELARLDLAAVVDDEAVDTADRKSVV